MRRSDQIKIAAKETNNRLIPVYKEQIKNLEIQSDGIAELCAKKVLAKTKCPDLYWVNNDFFSTGVFQPRYIEDDGCK